MKAITCSSADLCRCYDHCFSLCELVCTLLSYLEGLVTPVSSASPVSPTPSNSSSANSPDSKRRDLVEISHWPVRSKVFLEHRKSLLLCFCSRHCLSFSSRVCFSSHTLQVADRQSISRSRPICHNYRNNSTASISELLCLSKSCFFLFLPCSLFPK